MTTDLSKEPEAEASISGAEIVLDNVVKQYPGQKTPAVRTIASDHNLSARGAYEIRAAKGAAMIPA